jgi:ABC-type sulfate/molybdate transport systems ATPase subunit
LLLDEPFSALDEELRAGARELVRQAIGSEGIPTLLITHDRDDLKMLADRSIEIRNGRLLVS